MLRVMMALLVVTGCGGKDDGSSDDSGVDSSSGVDLDSLTWGGQAVDTSGNTNWLGLYAADEDNIWMLAGGGVSYYDGSTWSLSAEMTTFGFDPNAPDFTLLFDPWAISGSSATDVYVVSGNSMIAGFDGSSWQLLAEGYGEADLNTYQPLASPGSMWASGTGATYHLSRGGDYNFVSWDGAARSRDLLDIVVGNLDYPPYIVWGLDDDHIFVGGSLTSVFNSPIHYWDGSTWSRATIETGDEGKVVGFWGNSPDNVWMAATGNQYGSMLWRRTSEGGWERADTRPDDGTSNPVYYDIWGTSNQNLFVAANQGLFRYNGTDWTEIDLGTELGVLKIHGISATKLIVEVGTYSEKSLILVEGL